uniref:Glycylpeptide N-tetradecanoyltransferase n=1 Tax=Ditylenchus dipsaci TaxID=166011 RepID=A0A915CTN1_9BILA
MMTKENDEKKPADVSENTVATKKDKKKKQAEKPSKEDSSDVALNSVSNQDMVDLAKKIQLLQASTSAAKDITEAKQHNYQFWTTQPVPKLEEKITQNGPIEPAKDVAQIRSTPYSLPAEFVWSDIDIMSDDHLGELYTLLTENYVEDDENMFRFDYSPEFLRWALMAPGWFGDWHCGVRAVNSSKLLAFISAVPATIRIYKEALKMVEINFLCVHKKLRSKRVAPVLIREITRRVNLKGIFQATFTAGIIIPKPVGACRYWHRSLNPKKLIETNFSHVGKNMTLQRTLKFYKLPEEPRVNGLKKMESRHVSSAFSLLNNYLKKYDMAPVFAEDEFKHFFVPRDNVVYSFVIENPDGEVTDLISFYCLPSTVMNHAKHSHIKAAYSFYNVATTLPLSELMNNALIMAKKENFDVFNALDLMENLTFLEELKFGIGDGNLQYYLFNWKCPDLKPDRIGLVLQ